MQGEVYTKLLNYLQKYHGGIAWRTRKHCAVIEKHLNPGEHVIYAFAGQKNDSFTQIFTTCVVALTNKRILIGQKYLIVGYGLTSITPDLFNDLEVYSGFIWGKVVIDTIKEVVTLTNIDKYALPEIETNISEFMMDEKQKYPARPPLN
mgnify:FL=1